jgi:hypothetical protein
MKKIAIASLIAVAAAAQAGGFVSYGVDQVTNRVSNQQSIAQYVRAGTTLGGLNLGLQNRNARTNDNQSMFNSLELTAGKTVFGINPFVGVGFDNGGNGAKPYEYGLVGANAGVKVGPGYAMAGAKTRVNWDSANPKQSVVFATYDMPVISKVSVGLGVSQSYQDIQERAVGLTVSVGF